MLATCVFFLMMTSSLFPTVACMSHQGHFEFNHNHPLNRQEMLTVTAAPSPVGSKPLMGMSFLKGFGGIQKKAVATPPKGKGF